MSPRLPAIKPLISFLLVARHVVAPGQFRTEAYDDTYDEGVGDGFVDQPLPFLGRPDDIANAVVFLVSPAARFVTGEILRVDGGLTVQGPMSALPPGGYPERELPPSPFETD